MPYIRLGSRIIPSYGLCVACGIIVTGYISCRRAETRGQPFENILIYYACVIGGALVGAKVFYLIITYGVCEAISLFREGQYNILFQESGMVFYGGVIGGLLTIPIAEKITHSKSRDYYETVVPTIPLGHAIGRIGCFLAGCCYGREYCGFGAVRFSHALSGISPEISVVPVQLIEAAGNMLLAFYLLQRYSGKKDGKGVLERYLGIYAVMRFGLEFLRGDIERGSFLRLSTSQWISVLLVGIVVTRILQTEN